MRYVSMRSMRSNFKEVYEVCGPWGLMSMVSVRYMRSGIFEVFEVWDLLGLMSIMYMRYAVYDVYEVWGLWGLWGLRSVRFFVYLPVASDSQGQTREWEIFWADWCCSFQISDDIADIVPVVVWWHIIQSACREFWMFEARSATCTCKISNKRWAHNNCHKLLYLFERRN